MTCSGKYFFFRLRLSRILLLLQQGPPVFGYFFQPQRRWGTCWSVVLFRQMLCRCILNMNLINDSLLNDRINPWIWILHQQYEECFRALKATILSRRCLGWRLESLRVIISDFEWVFSTQNSVKWIRRYFFFQRSCASDFALNLMTKDAMVSSSFYTGVLIDLKDGIISATSLIGDQLSNHQCAFSSHMTSYKCSILMFISRKYIAFNLTQQIYFTNL